MSSEQVHYGSKVPLISGWLSLSVVIVGIALWATQLTIAGALVLSGVVEVEGNRQIVQHPEGGVIAKIFVDEGDAVEAGDILLRFESEAVLSELSVLTMQLNEIVAHKARLSSERDGLETVRFDQPFVGAAGSQSIATIKSGQLNLFLVRKEALEKEEALLHQRNAQLSTQVVGLKAQLEAVRHQFGLIAEELQIEQSLMSKGLSQADIIRALQREQSRLEGVKAGISATIAERRSRMAEVEIESLKLRTIRREEAITSLRNIQYNEIEMRARLRSVQATLDRLEVRAPASGVVYESQFHTERSVVRKAEPIMFIIPKDAQLVIRTKVPADQITRISIGQEVSLQFPNAASHVHFPPEGVVRKISPDIFTDETSGSAYYSATIAFEFPKGFDFEITQLLPGMPVQLFLETTQKTPLKMFFAFSTGY